MPPALETEEARETNTSPRPNSGIMDRDTASEDWMPETVLRSIPRPHRPESNTGSPIPFFHILERLKTTKREGWRRFGIKHGESISDHMYRMSIITMMAPRSLSSRLDIARCTKMALVHDMAELLVGDITPIDGVLKSEKSRREATTMDYLCKDLLGGVDDGVQGQEIREIWQEYEDSTTLESKFVHDVDKIELILQMLEYERAHEGRIDLGEFVWVARRIALPEVRQWCAQILGERDALWRDIGKEPSGGKMSEEREALQKEYYGDAQVNGTSANGADEHPV